VGIDLVPIDPLPNVRTFVGDVGDPAVRGAARDAVGGLADIVLSDLAPKSTGIAATDEARREQTVAAAIDALPDLLKQDGRFLVKLFMDPGHEAILARLRTLFTDVRTTRPEATRRGSSELYAIATGYGRHDS